jgi:hypothetical protein
MRDPAYLGTLHAQALADLGRVSPHSIKVAAPSGRRRDGFRVATAEPFG